METLLKRDTGPVEAAEDPLGPQVRPLWAPVGEWTLFQASLLSVSPVTLDLTLHLWEPKTVALGPFENLMKAMDLCSRIMCSMHTFNSLF